MRQRMKSNAVWVSEKDEVPPTSAFATQVGGDHYSRLRIGPTEFILANGLDYVEGNVVKYVVRYKVKGGLEDLKKARHYLDMLIESKEKEIESQNTPYHPGPSDSSS